MDNQTQNVTAPSDTAEAEQNKDQLQAETGLGKFKDVKALMDAYTNLEAEFTRRSQRLKQLESANKALGESAITQAENLPQPSAQQEESFDLLSAALADEQVKNAIIGEYLQNAAKSRGVQFVTGGVNVAAQRRTPTDFKQAARLTQDLLDKRDN
jgi:predicted nuclease with TOPRIM domain